MSAHPIAPHSYPIRTTPRAPPCAAYLHSLPRSLRRAGRGSAAPPPPRGQVGTAASAPPPPGRLRIPAASRSPLWCPAAALPLPCARSACRLAGPGRPSWLLQWRHDAPCTGEELPRETTTPPTLGFPASSAPTAAKKKYREPMVLPPATKKKYREPMVLPVSQSRAHIQGHA
jgi:hypothetical protein